ncbi:MAG: HNH endonuclease [Cyanobium sp. M30B3]|nr:MAG: HNH endonuclease [Cyanobium sp. M30B3]
MAGLSISNEINFSDERLFENLLVLWQHFGRQPRRSELASPPSVISQTPYNRRFGSWTAALHAFVDYANGTGAESPTSSDESVARRTGRDPSLRLRWRVLQRDRFSCRGCGASPALTMGVELHVDHVVPWSKGGETVFENLQTLCSECNLSKSNVG